MTTSLRTLLAMTAALGVGLPAFRSGDEPRSEAPPDPDKRSAAEKKRERKAARRLAEERIRRLDREAKLANTPEQSGEGGSK